jgi:hypothetical protein
MHIDKIREIVQLMDREIYPLPCISPEDVEGIDFQKSKIHNIKISYAIDEGEFNFDSPDCDEVTDVLSDYVFRYVSQWSYFYKKKCEPMPQNVEEICVTKIAEWAVFFIRKLGYLSGGGGLMIGVNHLSSYEFNKEVFLIFKTAFEEEEDPLSKVCLRELLLEFFGWDEDIKEECALNHGGLSEEDITYLRKLYEISIQQACSECTANQAQS